MGDAGRWSRRELPVALALLGLLSACFLLFAREYVPRLNNNVMSDMEFTGWSGPVASRVLAGERPYVDFVLPIPPGSFVVLALVQRVAGRALLLQELWLDALVHLALAWIAYAIAARFTTRLVAVMVAAATLVTVVQLPKECAYDHTAQLCAWSSVALGVQGIFAPLGRGRRRWWLGAGLTGGMTLFFKQSTATGVVCGWLLGLGYLALVGWREGGGAGARPALRDARAWALGVAMGLLAVWGGLAALGTPLAAFVQAVFRDAPALKGGTPTILGNLAAYVLLHDAFPASLALTAVALVVLVRLARGAGLHLGCEPERRASLDGRRALGLGAAMAACWLGALALLVSGRSSLPREVLGLGNALKAVPTFGLVFGVVFFVVHLLARAPAGDQAARSRLPGGHAFNALCLVSLASTLLHDTSFVVFKPFYQNNPTIPVAFLMLFVATQRARLGWLTALLFAAALGSLFSLKLDRALSVSTAVHEGHWAGMRVNYRGREILAAAQRVRALTRPDETVLVLPEDVQLAALIGRPRPRLRGAIVFVDQYAGRLAADDIRALDAAPPKVIVRHPRRERDWRRLFATWSEQSGAADVLEHVESVLLPGRYRRDSTFRTVYFWDQGQLDVWVRRQPGEAGP